MSKLYVDVFEENANRPLPIRQELNTGGSSDVNYSFDEQDTGLTWIDGKKIYQKTIELNRLTTAGVNVYTNLNISNLDKIIAADVFYTIEYPHDTDVLVHDFQLPYVHGGPSNTYILTYFFEGKQRIGLYGDVYVFDSPILSQYGHATLRYTCADR